MRRRVERLVLAFLCDAYDEEELEGGEAEFWLDDSVLRLDGGVNTVQVRLLDEEGEDLVNSRGTVEGEYTNAVSAYACFTKPVFE